YIQRIEEGVKATLESGNPNVELVVNKVYPSVRDNKFEIDLSFVEGAPAKMRVGQSITLNVRLSNETNKSLVLPKGSYIRETGGNYIYVMSLQGDMLTKRMIKIGRSNENFVEILGGLNIDERVVISSYSNFREAEHIRVRQ